MLLLKNLKQKGLFTNFDSFFILVFFSKFTLYIIVFSLKSKNKLSEGDGAEIKTAVSVFHPCLVWKRQTFVFLVRFIEIERIERRMFLITHHDFYKNLKTTQTLGTFGIKFFIIGVKLKIYEIFWRFYARRFFDQKALINITNCLVFLCCLRRLELFLIYLSPKMSSSPTTKLEMFAPI